MATTTENRPNRTSQSTPDISQTAPEDDARTILINEIKWGAVFAGALLAVSAQLIFNMAGIGLGLASFSVENTANNPDAETLSQTAVAWWAISMIIAAFIGGVAAGRLSGSPKHSTASWHGLTSWALTTLAMFYLIGSAAGAIVGTATSAATSAASGMAQSAGGAIRTAAQMAAPSLANQADPFASIEQSVRGGTGQDPAQLRDAAVAAVRAALTSDPAQAEEARSRAAEALARAQGIPVEQAREQVSRYETQYRQTVDQVRQQAATAAERTRETAATGSLWGALALLLAALASWFGGRTGAVYPTISSLNEALFRRS